MKTYVWDLFPLGAFSEAFNEGLIRIQDHPSEPYSIATYTNKAVITRAWNEVTRQCRGLIWNHETGEVLARPFRKFFNMGEGSYAPDPDWSNPFRIYDKADGSLGILYPLTGGGHAIATKGSFASEQAIHATKVWKSRYEGKWAPRGSQTALFEIIYPENRIVVDYGEQDDLILLGGVEIGTGMSYGPDLVWHWPGPVIKEFVPDDEGLHGPDMLWIRDRPNAEGLVIHFLTGDYRLKVKQQDYIEKHRVVTNLSEKTLWVWLGKSPEHLREMISTLPEEHQSWARVAGQRMIQEYTSRWDKVRTAGISWLGGAYLEDNRESKKDFVLYLLTTEQFGGKSWEFHAAMAWFEDHSDRMHSVIHQSIKPSL